MKNLVINYTVHTVNTNDHLINDLNDYYNISDEDTKKIILIPNEKDNINSKNVFIIDDNQIIISLPLNEYLDTHQFSESYVKVNNCYVIPPKFGHEFTIINLNTLQLHKIDVTLSSGNRNTDLEDPYLDGVCFI